MKAMSEAPPPPSADEDGLNPPYSPTNSATTGLSIGSSLGLQYKGVWCNPPRVFVDYQDEVIPHLEPGMVPSTVDPDDAGQAERAAKAKKAVKISAWKLAKLNAGEAVKAAAKAHASFSVLRPIDGRHRIPTDAASADQVSSDNASIRSSKSLDCGNHICIFTKPQVTMLRHHGWQLPTHAFQVVAIALFSLLVPAFYAFFAPFLGKHIFEYASIAIYTPVALVVFILYIRCARINPADSGIMEKSDDEIINRPNNLRLQGIELPASAESNRTGTQSSPSTACTATDGDYSGCPAGHDTMIDIPRDPPRKTVSTCSFLGGIICAIFAKEDCRKDDIAEQRVGEEDAFFCELCKAEVQKLTKHCRSCDKCVDGFDHHCQWINNCVGRKNYRTFLSLVATSIIWFTIQFGAGVAVLVLCFVDKKGTERNIVDKFGNGFSHAAFATVVTICTLISLLASVPLGELFIFHLILIKKGITTYVYVMQMKAMREVPLVSANEDDANLTTSQTSSATTGLSVTSSLPGLWCNPPGDFMDLQQYCQWLNTFY